MTKLDRDPEHPRNLIPELCKQFYHLDWVTGTGGGISIKYGFVCIIALMVFLTFFIHPSFVFVTYQPVHQIYYVLIDHVQTKRSKDCVS